MVTMVIPGLPATPPLPPLRLEIPLDTIHSLCVYPTKWLRYVGWAIFQFTEGFLSTDSHGNNRVNDEMLLNENDVLFYQAPGKLNF